MESGGISHESRTCAKLLGAFNLEKKHAFAADILQFRRNTKRMLRFDLTSTQSRFLAQFFKNLELNSVIVGAADELCMLHR
jgi:hypothetical protein